jgi:hypothetical protein
MEEKIIEILNAEVTPEYGSTREAAKEITAHMFSFITWFLSDEDCPFIQSRKNKKGKLQFITEIDEPYSTLEDVYQYFLTNVKK